jgi:single-strand DNA-binding protein
MRGIECAFTGRVGRDAEAKVSAKGALWAAFSVAVDGNDEQSTWIKVAAFGDVARRCVDELRKGSAVYVEGALRLSSWQDKQTGETRHALECAAWHVSPLGPGKNKPARPKDGPGGPRAPSDAAAANGRPAPSQAAARRDWQRPADTGPRPARETADAEFGF